LLLRLQLLMNHLPRLQLLLLLLLLLRQFRHPKLLLLRRLQKPPLKLKRH
jgi:hypothetical protein